MLRALIASTALSLSLAAAVTPASLAQDTTPAPTLSLSATAEIQIEPEYATVRSGVVIRADTAEAAVRQNAQMMSRVFRALREAEVAEADMQTANLSVRPVYAPNSYNREEGPRLVGYEARNTVSAKVRELAGVGAVIDAMVSAGANNIEGVTFGADDTAEQMDEARRMAVGRLLDKANLYAEAAGFELCGIRRMGEAFGQPQFANAVAMRSYAESDDTSVAAGTLTLSATVNADFCITP